MRNISPGENRRRGRQADPGRKKGHAHAAIAKKVISAPMLSGDWGPSRMPFALMMVNELEISPCESPFGFSRVGPHFGRTSVPPCQKGRPRRRLVNAVD